MNYLDNKIYKVFNIDKISYASEENNELNYIKNKRYKFYKYDLSDKSLIKEIVFEILPDLIILLQKRMYIILLIILNFFMG